MYVFCYMAITRDLFWLELMVGKFFFEEGVEYTSRFCQKFIMSTVVAESRLNAALGDMNGGVRVPKERKDPKPTDYAEELGKTPYGYWDELLQSARRARPKREKPSVEDNVHSEVTHEVDSQNDTRTNEQSNSRVFASDKSKNAPPVLNRFQSLQSSDDALLDEDETNLSDHEVAEQPVESIDTDVRESKDVPSHAPEKKKGKEKKKKDAKQDKQMSKKSSKLDASSSLDYAILVVILVLLFMFLLFKGKDLMRVFTGK